MSTIPTTADIYLEIAGVKVAVVQSYTAVVNRDSRVVQAFGQNTPVAAVRGPETYTIRLSRLYATDEAIQDGIHFMIWRTFLWSSASRTGRSSTEAASGPASASRLTWATPCWRK